MSPFALGPVEFDVILLDEDRVPPGVLRAFVHQLDIGGVRLIDIALLTRNADGLVSISEVNGAEYALAGLEPLVPGLIGEDDLEGFAGHVPPGRSAVAVALELVWQRELAEELAQSRAAVLVTERIPAPVVNAVLEVALDG